MKEVYIAYQLFSAGSITVQNGWPVLETDKQQPQLATGVSIWTKGSNCFHPVPYKFNAYITAQFEGSFPEICPILWLYVTGSEKRYIVAHNMIFLYKRCCSKTRNIFYSLKKLFFLLRYLQLFAYTHAKFEELYVLLTGQARCLKTST